MIDTLLSHPLLYNVLALITFPEKAKMVKTLCKCDSFASILDVGCGTGKLNSYFPNSRFVGIDSNERYIEYARKRFSGDFYCCDLTKFDGTGFEKYFDYIVFNSIFHHLPEAKIVHALRLYKNLLKRDGRIIVIDHLGCENLNVLNRFLNKLDRGVLIRNRDEFYEMWKEDLTVDREKRFCIHHGPIVLWQLICYVLKSDKGSIVHT